MPVSRPPGPIRTKTFPPWGVLAIDLLRPLPINETISVVVEYYSRFYEINILRSTVASRVISSLQDMFARHGLHESVASNNGTRFTTTEFTEYMVQQGIRYHKVTGKWPQANEEGACWKWSKFAHAVKTALKEEINFYLSAYIKAFLTQQQVQESSCITFWTEIVAKLSELSDMRSVWYK